MTGRCPNCHKDFTILYPQMWAYKRNSDYFCSWKCLRAADKEERSETEVNKRIVSRDQKAEAVQICLKGGDPLRYLQQCGSTNPPNMWYMIKQELKKTDPATYAKLPKRIARKDAVKKEPTLADAMVGMQEAADIFFDKFEKIGLTKTEPAKIAIVKDPENPDKPKLLNYRVLKLETPLCRYIKKEDGDLVIMQKDDNYGIRMCAEELYQLIVELPAVMEFMGVK